MTEGQQQQANVGKLLGGLLGKGGEGGGSAAKLLPAVLGMVGGAEGLKGLAQVLPNAVDKLTPQGEVPKETPKLDIGHLQQHLSKLMGHSQ